MPEPERASAAEVAVAVVSWNTRELLARCLESLRADAAAGRVQVWVVDNASADGSAAMVRERFPWVQLIESTENLGFGGAVNEVARRTDAGWIAPSNADVELTGDAIERLLGSALLHPRAGAVAPRLDLPDGSVQHSVYAFPTFPFTLAFNLGLQRVLPGLGDRLCLQGYWNPARGRRVDWAVGAFLLVRREAFDEIGGFDPGRWMYAEDLDLGWQLARHGWETRYEPAAVVRHHESAATAAAWGELRTERWQASTYAWLLRRRGYARTRTVAFVNVAGAAVRAAVFVPLARLAPSRWGRSPAYFAGWARLHARTGFAPRRVLERHR